MYAAQRFPEAGGLDDAVVQLLGRQAADGHAGEVLPFGASSGRQRTGELVGAAGDQGPNQIFQIEFMGNEILRQGIEQFRMPQQEIGMAPQIGDDLRCTGQSRGRFLANGGLAGSRICLVGHRDILTRGQLQLDGRHSYRSRGGTDISATAVADKVMMISLVPFGCRLNNCTHNFWL